MPDHPVILFNIVNDYNETINRELIYSFRIESRNTNYSSNSKTITQPTGVNPKLGHIRVVPFYCNEPFKFW